MMCNEIWMMHAKDLGYQLVIGRNERWISNVWLIQSPVRVAGYFKCMPTFLGKIQWAAWCPQQLAPNSWQLLHLPLRRVPALHQGLVSCLNLPWRMTLMIGEETVSKGTHVRRSEREMLPMQFKWLLRNRLNLLWHGHYGFHGAWGVVCSLAQAGGAWPHNLPPAQEHSEQGCSPSPLSYAPLFGDKVISKGFNALNVWMPVCMPVSDPTWQDMLII